MVVDVNGSGKPLTEIQIRTAEINLLASDGAASHAIYKGGVTNATEAKRLKIIMNVATEYVALHLKDFTSINPKGNASRDRIFHLLDKNEDGKIRNEELTEVMIEIGAQGDDATP